MPEKMRRERDIRYHEKWYEKNAGEKPVSTEMMAKRITNLRRIGQDHMMAALRKM